MAKRSSFIFECMTSLVEVLLGYIIVILLYRPMGSLQLYACFTSEEVAENIGAGFEHIHFNNDFLMIILPNKVHK